MSARLPRLTPGRVLVYALLALASMAALLPFYKMGIGSIQTPANAINGLQGLKPPSSIYHQNYHKLFASIPVWRNLANSALVATAATLGYVAISTLAGFAFAKHRFRGRSLLFGLMVSTMAIPVTVVIIPLFVTMRDLGWVNTYQALILSPLMSGFGIFWMRQNIASAVPDELLDAARMDGAGELRIVLTVVVPLVRPALAALACLWFMLTWNDFFWPLIATNQTPMFTMPVAVGALAGEVGDTGQFGAIMAGSVIGTAPLLILFFLLRGNFVSGLTEGAVK